MKTSMRACSLYLDANYVLAFLLHARVRVFFTRYRTAGMDMRGHSRSLYHSRQCGIVIKPRLDCPGYTIVCFMTKRLQPKTVKTVAVQAKCGLITVNVL